MEIKKNSPKKKDSIIFLLGGVLLIIISIFFKTTFPHCIYLFDVLMELLAHFGIGFMVIGLLAILIDSTHWTEYFERRLSKIVTEKSIFKR